MARFKQVNMPPRFLPMVLEEQLIPGTFEHALHALIDSESDLTPLAAKYKNDETGTRSYDPAVMFKAISRAIGLCGSMDTGVSPSRLMATTLSW